MYKCCTLMYISACEKNKIKFEIAGNASNLFLLLIYDHVSNFILPLKPCPTAIYQCIRAFIILIQWFENIFTMFTSQILIFYNTIETILKPWILEMRLSTYSPKYYEVAVVLPLKSIMNSYRD